MTEATEEKTLFGFWVYLMTDCVLFSILFATYVVLHSSLSREIFNPSYALTETLILLTSSFTCGMARLGILDNSRKKVMSWFAITFLLGLSFLTMELNEFTRLVQEGHSWQQSGFLSAFFTLVGTHGGHITVGLLWMAVMMIQVWKKGLTPFTVKRLNCLRLFWHFLDVVWIFIFTFVYLMGVK